MSTIVMLNKRRPDTALENLNRLTGLNFSHWPDSLLDPAVQQEEPQSVQDEPVFTPPMSQQG